MSILHHNARGVYPARIPKSIPITVNHRGRSIVIGYVIDDTLVKAIVGSKHLLLHPPALALDLQSLLDAQQAGATRVAITDCETSKVYSAPVSLMHDRGFRLNRGFGDQVALALEYWSVNGRPSEHERNQAIQQAKQIQAGQLSLFGGVR